MKFSKASFSRKLQDRSVLGGRGGVGTTECTDGVRRSSEYQPLQNSWTYEGHEEASECCTFCQ
eukprot:464882-Rhodomonas_salina.2